MHSSVAAVSANIIIKIVVHCKADLRVFPLCRPTVVGGYAVESIVYDQWQAPTAWAADMAMVEVEPWCAVAIVVADRALASSTVAQIVTKWHH